MCRNSQDTWGNHNPGPAIDEGSPMTRNALRRRRVAGGLLLVLMTAACSPAKLPNAQRGTGDAGLVPQSAAPGESVAPGTPGASATPGAKGGKGAKAGQGTKTSAPGQPGAPGGPGTPGATNGPIRQGERPPAPPADKPGDLNLFQGDLNTRGIHSDKIVLCGHAALTYADAFQTRPEDFNVFWTDLNAKGGIHGRKVEMSYEDDAYDPVQARTAATNCQRKNPFLIMGGIGFDQIPSVRKWAEDNRELYIHHDAQQPDHQVTYSYSPIPTVEQFGHMFAELAAAKFRGKKIGVLYRESDYWKPGFDAFKDTAKRHGLNLGKLIPVQKNQANYGQQLVALQQDGTEVVWAWENALAATEIINQAPPGFRPSWMVFPFNLTTQTLVDKNQDIYGVASWPAYSYRDYAGPFASYAADIKEFERQYAQWRPNVDLSAVGGDLLFLNWVAQKALAQLLRDCGPACSRNHFATLLQGYRGTVSPNCHTDYPRFGGHLGSQAVNVFKTYTGPSGKYGWQPIHRCVERLV